MTKSFVHENSLPLSVIICTYNRADLLDKALESLTKQTLSKDEFEVVLIDDGSSDHTKEVANVYKAALPVKYFYQNNAGLASARNHGIFAARGRILFFFDDDDVAAPTLLEEHLKTHQRYHEDYYGVLNFTQWAPHLYITPLMEFVTNIGCFLFSYREIRDGGILDYTFFWGGRSSCKRSFLIEHGVFNPVFRFGCEDIELGYRLSKYGFRIIYNKKAVSMMSRPVLFDEFCQRLVRQGKSQYIFSALHNDHDVHRWAEVIGADEQWTNIKTIYEAKVKSARELDKIAQAKITYHLELDDLTRKLLYRAYWWAFRACKINGIIQEKEENLNN